MNANHTWLGARRQPGGQAGFSLIEVLLAVVILSVGLLALATLQASLTRGAANTRSQAVGLELAESKLEDVRSFNNATTYNSITGATDSVPASSLTGGVDYSRQITITRYCKRSSDTNYITSTSDPTNCAVTGSTDYDSDFKLATVTVSWTGPTGSDSVVLSDVISAVQPGDSGHVVTDESVTRPNPEVRIFTPTETGVIPIATGDSDTDQSSASSNPKPVQEATGAGATITRFNVQTYLNESGQNPLLQRRLEFAVVSCRCTLSATLSNSSSNTAYEPSFWDGSFYTKPRKITNKRTADAVDLLNNQQDNDQFDLLCQSCCHDHHDAPSTARDSSNNLVGASVAQRSADEAASDNPPPYRFDPYRPDGTNSTASDMDTGSGGSGDHFLYNNTTPSNLTSPTLSYVSTSGSTYNQTCRLVRVDGSNYVTVDTKLENMITIRTSPTARATSDSTNVTLNTTDVNNYKNFARSYLLGAIGNNGQTGNNAISLPTGYPVVPLSNQLYSDTAQTTLSTLATTYNSSSDASATATNNLLNMQNSRKQTVSTLDNYYNVHMRGLYVDFLSREAQNAVACIDQTTDPSCSDFSSKTLLDVVPFFAVNMTNLAYWTKPSDSSDIVLYSLSNGFPQTYGADFTRAVVRAKANGETPANGFSFRGNESLTDQIATDPHDAGQVSTVNSVTRDYTTVATYGKAKYDDTEQIVSGNGGSSNNVSTSFKIVLVCSGCPNGGGQNALDNRLSLPPVYLQTTTATSGQTNVTTLQCANQNTANTAERTCDLNGLTNVGTIALSFASYNVCNVNNAGTDCQNNSKRYTFCGFSPSSGNIANVTYSHSSPSPYNYPSSTFNYSNEISWETLTTNGNNLQTVLPAFNGYLNAAFVPYGDTCPTGYN